MENLLYYRNYKSISFGYKPNYLVYHTRYKVHIQKWQPRNAQKNGSYLPPFQPRVCECARVSVCVNVCGIRASFIQTIPSNTTHVSPISSPLTPFVGQHTWLSLFMSQIWANAYAMPRLDGLAWLGWKPPTCHPLATPPTAHLPPPHTYQPPLALLTWLLLPLCMHRCVFGIFNKFSQK